MPFVSRPLRDYLGSASGNQWPIGNQSLEWNFKREKGASLVHRLEPRQHPLGLVRFQVQLLEPDPMRLILTPPFVVMTRTVGPPEPRFTANSLVMRPCTVTGKSTLRCPLTVPVSRCAE